MLKLKLFVIAVSSRFSLFTSNGYYLLPLPMIAGRRPVLLIKCPGLSLALLLKSCKNFSKGIGAFHLMIMSLKEMNRI